MAFTEKGVQSVDGDTNLVFFSVKQGVSFMSMLVSYYFDLDPSL